MNLIPGALECPCPSTCFVPTGSAIGLMGEDPWEDLHGDVSEVWLAGKAMSTGSGG
ncbi:Hypothetical protein A7982_10953 [Minicystis rosea]|nr:Hypothetical protein A7982_10953 [Minicystis rosea]